MIKNNSFPEMAIQQIWLEQDFDQVTLKTICGYLALTGSII